ADRRARRRRRRRSGIWIAAAKSAASGFIDGAANSFPRRSGIVRTEESALSLLRRHQRVNGVRILWIDPQTGAAHLDGRQALRQLREMRPAIRALVNAAAGSAAYQLPNLAPPLKHRHVDRVR